jgi:glycosyltransferase involved in cell wall biosynthesis
MDSPLVSIIVPCYKQAEYLPEALDSVLAQTYPHWECVVVDDASPDNTKQVALTYAERDARIFLLDLQQNVGLPGARNAGIKATHGDYILPLDADDKIAPTFLEKLIKAFFDNYELKMVYTDVQHFGDRHDLSCRLDFSLKTLSNQNIVQPIALFKRIDFEKTGGYRINTGYEDWDFWLQLINEDSEVVHIKEPLTYMRVKANSMIKDIQRKPEIERALRKEIYLKNRKKIQTLNPSLALSYERKLKFPDITFLISQYLNRLF